MADVKVEEKKTKKHRVLKILAIIGAVIVAVAITAVIVINVMTKPVSDTLENAPSVGGLRVSDTINYKSESAEGLENNFVIKFMQFVWKFCEISDDKVHEKQTPPENIVKVKDIPYIDDGNPYHQLYVLYPDNLEPGETLPVIIDIHGGGWMYSTKDLNENYCLSLADRGFVVFNLSYRLVPDVTVNEQIQDIAYALKWISENMTDYPCNPENIMLTGDSAGGQLSVYSAVLLQSPELREIFNTVDADMDLTALVLTSPVPYMNSKEPLSVYTKILWGKNYKDKSTYNYMNLDEIIDYAHDLPPTYLITSSGDSLAHDQTVKAYELLESKGVKCELADYGKVDGKKLAHVFSVLNPYDEAGKTAINKAIEFYRDAIENK